MNTPVTLIDAGGKRKPGLIYVGLDGDEDGTVRLAVEDAEASALVRREDALRLGLALIAMAYREDDGLT